MISWCSMLGDTVMRRVTVNPLALVVQELHERGWRAACHQTTAYMTMTHQITMWHLIRLLETTRVAETLKTRMTVSGRRQQRRMTHGQYVKRALERFAPLIGNGTGSRSSMRRAKLVATLAQLRLCGTNTDKG